MANNKKSLSITGKKSLSMSNKKSLSRFSRRGSLKGRNEDWPEIIGVEIGQCQKVKMEQPAEKKETEIDVQHISEGDLQNLKARDPFSYYSIPGVRSAKMLLKDVDMSNLGTCGLGRGAMSCPSRMQSAQATQATTSVTRRSRITFEVYPDLLEEDEIDEASLVCSDTEDDDDLDDPLDALLARLTVQ